MFGSISDSIKKSFFELCDGIHVEYIGWLNVKETYEIINAADLVVFPCLHSVMWEQSVGLGIPGIYHEIVGTEHIEYKNSCIRLKHITQENLSKTIDWCIANNKEMLKDAIENSSRFMYSKIAKDAIEEL